jgi:hypothetical protein
MCTQNFTNIIYFHFKKTTKTLAVITAANTSITILVRETTTSNFKKIIQNKNRLENEQQLSSKYRI